MDLNKLRGVAAQQMYKHKLSDWTFGLADTGRRLGVCKYRTKRIEIAEHYAKNSPESNVMDTLMHEIAHAVAGPGTGHGPIWKAVAIRLGATPRSCDTANDTVVKPGDWQAKCPSCKQVYNRYKRPRCLSGYRCNRCPARSPMTFEFMGDPALKPVVPHSIKDVGSYQATCGGCGTHHRKMRRPTPGKWSCRCKRPGSKLVWRFVAPKAAAKIILPPPDFDDNDFDECGGGIES